MSTLGKKIIVITDRSEIKLEKKIRNIVRVLWQESGKTTGQRDSMYGKIRQGKGQPCRVRQLQ